MTPDASFSALAHRLRRSIVAVAQGMRCGLSANSGAKFLARRAAAGAWRRQPLGARLIGAVDRNLPVLFPLARRVPGRRARGLPPRLYPHPQHAQLRSRFQELQFRRARPLRNVAYEPAILGRLRTHVLLHGAIGRWVHHTWHDHGTHPKPRIPRRPLGSHRVPLADGGDASRHIARLDDDVQPDPRGPELSSGGRSGCPRACGWPTRNS